MYKVWAACDVMAKSRCFFESIAVTSQWWRHQLKPNFSENFWWTPTACQILCPHNFWWRIQKLKRHFLRLFWSSQNRKSVIFELAPGPRSALGAPAGSPPNLQTTHEGNFCTCNRTLFSDYFDQSLTTRSPERGFSTNITPTLHLVQPHCASITKHRHHKWHHSSNLPQMQDSCVSNKNWTRQFTKNFGVSL